MTIAGPPSAVSRASVSTAARHAACSAGLSTRSSGGYPQMNSSGSRTRSAPVATALARAPRALSALPATSPTSGLSWAMVMASRLGTLMAIHLAPARQGGNGSAGVPPAVAKKAGGTPALPGLNRGRCGQRQPPAEAFFLQKLGKQKRQLDRLFGVQARIAEGVVAIVEVFFADGAGAAGTFRDILAGHLQVDAARIGAFRLMNGEKRLDLGQDAIERPGLVAGTGRDGVPVHRIARPHHLAPFAGYGAHQRRQQVADLFATHATDERETAGRVLRVEDVDQTQEVVGLQ